MKAETKEDKEISTKIGTGRRRQRQGRQGNQGEAEDRQKARGGRVRQGEADNNAR